MKICNKCGAQQSDGRFFCIDCGETLPKSLTEEEAAQQQEKAAKKLERLYNKTDPFYVSIIDKCVGFASIVSFITAIILLIIPTDNIENIGLIVSLFFFPMSAVILLIPEKLWRLKQIDLSCMIENADDAKPSYLYMMYRKIAGYVMCAFGILCWFIEYWAEYLR